MSRNRFLISCALRHLFLNDFGLDRVFIMNDLAALFSYYADRDASPQLFGEYNKLNVWLTKVELLRKPRKEEPYPSVKELGCKLDTDGSEVSVFTFAPEIHMPEMNAYAIDEDILRELGDELIDVDVAALISFVREKALAAGDLTLNDIEGDDHW